MDLPVPGPRLDGVLFSELMFAQVDVDVLERVGMEVDRKIEDLELSEDLVPELRVLGEDPVLLGPEGPVLRELVLLDEVLELFAISVPAGWGDPVAFSES